MDTDNNRIFIGRKMILSIGEILFDVFPEYKRLGGAPFNFAFHMKRLGFPVCFISRIGNDAAGETISQKLRKYGFGLDCLQRDDDLETGKVIIRTDENGIPDFNILQNSAYDNLAFDNSIKTMLNHKVALIYFGSLVQRSSRGFTTLQHIFKQKRPDAKLLYDVNLRPECYSSKIIIESLAHTDILKLNDEELHTIKEIFGFKKSDKAFINFLFKEFDIEMIALTRGSWGSKLFTENQHAIHRSNGLKDIVDTVGAGDSFAAILAIGYLQKWPLDKILSIATTFAEQICRIKGAVPRDTGFYYSFKRIIEQR